MGSDKSAGMRGPYIGPPRQRRPPISRKRKNKSVSRTRKEICQKLTCRCRIWASKPRDAAALSAIRLKMPDLTDFLSL